MARPWSHESWGKRASIAFLSLDIMRQRIIDVCRQKERTFEHTLKGIIAYAEDLGMLKRDVQK